MKSHLKSLDGSCVSTMTVDVHAEEIYSTNARKTTNSEKEKKQNYGDYFASVSELIGF